MPLDWTDGAESGLCLRSAAGKGPDCTEAEVYCIETARPQLPGPECTEDSTEDLGEEEFDTGQEEGLRREEAGCTVYCPLTGPALPPCYCASSPTPARPDLYS